MGSWQQAGRMLRGLRENRGWEVPKLAAELKAKATAIGQAVPDRQSLVRMIYELGGGHPPTTRLLRAVRPGLCDRGGTRHAYHQARVRATPPDGSLESDGSAGEPATVPPQRRGPRRRCRRPADGRRQPRRAGAARLGAQAPTQCGPPHRLVSARAGLRPHEAIRGGGVTYLATAPNGRAACADHSAA